MMALLFSRVGFIFMGLVAGIAVIIGAYAFGHSSGIQQGREAALERSVDILRERAKTDDEINDMDARSLCIALGGEWLPDGSCV